MEDKKDKWQHPQTLPRLQVATSLHLGSRSPKKVGSEQVAQLMKNNPKKDLGNLIKNTQCRELRLHIFQEKNHSGGMHFKEFIGKGKL